MKNKSFILPAYIILLFVMFLLPFFSASGYSIVTNTTSQLGAQNTPNSWIMNLTFVLLGLACIWESVNYLKTYWINKTLLIVFGLGLIFTAIFQHAPIDLNLPYDLLKDQLHSFFASLIGFSFTAFSFSATFIESTRKRKIIAFLMGFIASGLSFLMFSLTEYTGIWQRMMFIISFAWIIFFFKRRKKEIIDN